RHRRTVLARERPGLRTSQRDFRGDGAGSISLLLAGPQLPHRTRPRTPVRTGGGAAARWRPAPAGARRDKPGRAFPALATLQRPLANAHRAPLGGFLSPSITASSMRAQTLRWSS